MTKKIWQAYDRTVITIAIINCVIGEEGKPMMPLVFAREGDTVTIRRIAGREDVRQHLAELGFVVDSPVLIVSHMAGNLIVQVKGSRVALDRSMAQKIFY